MSNIKVIAKAWGEVLKGVTTEEHKRRASICYGCKLKKHKKFLDFINDDLKEVKGYVCGVCTCPLIALIRSEDTCEKGYWDLKKNIN